MHELILETLVVEPCVHPYECDLINDKEIISFFISEDTFFDCRIGLKHLDDSVCILYNFDAKKHNLEANRIVNGKVIYGTFYIVGMDKNDNLVSLTYTEKEKYSKIFWNIPTILV